MTEKEAITTGLLGNYKYSSSWVKNASILITEYGHDEAELAKYTGQQLEVIVSAYTSSKNNSEIKIERFFNPELNESQMQVLLNGYSAGITDAQIDKYFIKYLPYAISNWGLTALAEGYDMWSYIDTGFNPDQLREIYSGYKDKIDVSEYAKIEISAEKMFIARSAMVMGLNVTINENNELTIY